MQRCREKLRKSLFFLRYHILIGCVKLSLLRREYLSLAVIALTNSLKILDNTKRDFFELNRVYSDQ